MPATIGALFGLAFNLTDAFVAGFWSTDAQAALGFSFPLYYVVLAFSVGLARSAAGLVSRAMGSQEKARAKTYAFQLATCSVVTGIAIGAAGLATSRFFAKTLGASAQQADMTAQYLGWVYLFSPVFVAMMMFTGLLSAHGNTHSYRNALGAGALLNLVLDPVLMFGWLGLPKLGMHGLGMATAASQVAMLTWLLVASARLGLFGKVSLAKFAPRTVHQKAIAIQSIPPTLNMLSISLGFFIYTYFLGHIDTKAVAAYGIAHRIDQVIQLLASGFGVGLLSIAGQSYGARLFGRLAEAHRSADRHVIAITAAGGLFMLAFGWGVIWLFNQDKALVMHGYGFLVAAAFVGPTHAILHNCIMMLQAVGRPAMIVPLSIARMVVLPLLLCWAFVIVADLGVIGVWLSFFAANTIIAVIARMYTMSLLGKITAQAA